MEAVSIKELWMLLGEKDVQIYQLLKTVEVMGQEMEAMRAAHSRVDRPEPSPAAENSKAPGEDQRTEDEREAPAISSD